MTALSRMRMALVLALLLGVGHAHAQSFEVLTDKLNYDYGEDIRVTATLVNDTDRTLTFHLSFGGPRPVIDEFNAWDIPVSPMEVPHELGPGEALVWKMTVSPALSGLPQQDGWHRLRLTVGTSGFEDDSFILADSVIFEAPPYLGGQVKVAFADADTTYARTVQDSLDAQVVETAAFSGKHFQTWRFEGTSLADAVDRFAADARFAQFTPYRTFEETGFYRLPARRPLHVSVDTLYYPVERDIVLTNTMQQPVTITGLSISRSHARAWSFGLVDGDPMHYWDLNAYGSPDAPVGLILDPDANLTLRVEGFDSCIVCKSDVLSTLQPDTLFIHTDASGIPDTVILDLSNYVSAESVQQPGSLQADVYPNPARDVVTVEVNAPARRPVTVEVFDVLGRRVTTLVKAVPPAGIHHLAFDGADLPSGLYLCRVTAGNETIIRPFTLAR